MAQGLEEWAVNSSMQLDYRWEQGGGSAREGEKASCLQEETVQKERETRASRPEEHGGKVSGIGGSLSLQAVGWGTVGSQANGGKERIWASENDQKGRGW